MIVRINTGKSVAGAIRYNEYKASNGEAELLAMRNYSTLTSFPTIQQKISEQEVLASLNQRVQKTAVHIPIAFHATDILTNDQLKDIGDEYMAKMGYGEQPYLLYRHYDTHHPHMHIVTVCIDRNGKKISDSNNFFRSEKIRKELEKKYNLTIAEGRGHTLQKSERQEVINYGDKDLRAALQSIVYTACNDYSFTRLSDFESYLRTQNIHFKIIESTKNGKNYKGISFRILDNNKIISQSIKASKFSYSLSVDRLQKQFDNNMHRVKSQRSLFINKIQNCLSHYKSISEHTYSNALLSSNIHLVDTGSKYIYIDHSSRLVYSEDDLGRGFKKDTLINKFSNISETKSNPILKDNINTNDVTKENELPSSAEMRRISKIYQQLRKISSYYFESQFISEMPVNNLKTKLLSEDVNPERIDFIIQYFNSYKNSQLPEITAKELAYFEKNTKMYIELASMLPLSTQNRIDFLQALNIKLTNNDQGSLLALHTKNEELAIKIPRVNQKKLVTTDVVNQVTMPFEFNKFERAALLSLAKGEYIEKLTFNQISINKFRRILPENLFLKAAQDLTSNYLTQVITSAPISHKDEELLEHFYNRGFIINSSGTQIRFLGLPVKSSCSIPNELKSVLVKLENTKQEKYKSSERLNTPEGHLLINLLNVKDGALNVSNAMSKLENYRNSGAVRQNIPNNIDDAISYLQRYVANFPVSRERNVSTFYEPETLLLPSETAETSKPIFLYEGEREQLEQDRPKRKMNLNAPKRRKRRFPR